MQSLFIKITFLLIQLATINNNLCKSIKLDKPRISIMGSAISTTQFYLYGRKHFRQPGYLENVKHYKDPVQECANIGLNQAGSDGVCLQDKVVVITGSNSGIGKELATYAAAKGAKLFMVCRSEKRALEARTEILESIKSDPNVDANNVQVLLCDLGETKEVRRLVKEIQGKTPKVDVLVCNAGVLLNDRQETSDGNEVTFATHLLCGSYMLSTLLIPQLEAAGEEARVVFVSSGGMYPNPFPNWEKAVGKQGYEGNAQYSYAKRGQVLLAETYVKKYPSISWLSAHPGWTATPAVDLAYGSQAKYLEPMRTPWQGAEGIAWLMSAPKAQLESGAFYLDRSPQRKHLSGPFFTEGSYTKNSQAEIDEMMIRLKETAGL